MSAKKSKAVSFEEAMAELETIVAALERGEGTLDESIVLFTRGMELTGMCNSILKTIEGKITKLTEPTSGTGNAGSVFGEGAVNNYGSANNMGLDGQLEIEVPFDLTEL